MKATFTYAVRYWVHGTCETPLRTGGVERDLQTVLHRADDDIPILQASSLAGALRGWRDSEALFGSQDAEGSLILSDCLFASGTRQAVRPRLRIDGQTGAASKNGKFDVAHLETGSRFQFELVWRGGTDFKKTRQEITACLATLSRQTTGTPKGCSYIENDLDKLMEQSANFHEKKDALLQCLTALDEVPTDLRPLFEKVRSSLNASAREILSFATTREELAIILAEVQGEIADAKAFIEKSLSALQTLAGDFERTQNDLLERLSAWDSGDDSYKKLWKKIEGLLKELNTGTLDCQKAQEGIETLLSALNSGLIRLGAQKSNGFGRVSVRVKKRLYDLTLPGDRRAWLDNDGEAGGAEVALADLSEKRVVFRITGTFGSLLVKAQTGTGVGESGINCLQLKENCRPVIPGSSIKGAMRAHINRIAPYCHLQKNELNHLFGRASEKGDNGIAGKILFSDAVFTREQSRKITRIRINRFTGGVIRGGLFSEKPVSGPCVFTITIPEKEQRGCALIAYALRDLGLGLFNLGSGDAIGRGRLSDLRVEITSPGGRSASLHFDGGQPSIQDPHRLLARWADTLASGGVQQ